MSASPVTPENPSPFSSRFEIRRLTPEHLEWTKAIVAHSNIFHSPFWPVLYPVEKTARNNACYKTLDYLVAHQIASGMSFGVFDTQYSFKRPESAATGGALYWDESEPSIEDAQGLEAESKRLLAQMDFPLCSVALSFDGVAPLDKQQMRPLVATLPAFADIYYILVGLDPRALNSWAPTGPKQVLMRNSTATRQDYAGEKLMGRLVQWLMKEAAREGYRGIQIECVQDAVHKVWSQPPEPFKGTVIAGFESKDQEREGKKIFEPVDQRITKVYVTLREPREGEIAV